MKKLVVFFAMLIIAISGTAQRETQLITCEKWDNLTVPKSFSNPATLYTKLGWFDCFEYQTRTEICPGDQLEIFRCSASTSLDTIASNGIYDSVMAFIQSQGGIPSGLDVPLLILQYYQGIPSFWSSTFCFDYGIEQVPVITRSYELASGYSSNILTQNINEITCPQGRFNFFFFKRITDTTNFPSGKIYFGKNSFDFHFENIAGTLFLVVPADFPEKKLKKLQKADYKDKLFDEYAIFAFYPITGLEGTSEKMMYLPVREMEDLRKEKKEHDIPFYLNVQVSPLMDIRSNVGWKIEENPPF